MIHETSLRTRLLVKDDAALLCPCVLRFDPADPYAVKATFTAAGDDVSWVFSRDLLNGGTTNSVGVGDVKMWPADDGAVMYVSLSSPEGEALVELPIPEVKAFLDFTYRIVAAGSESMDVDAMISMINGD